jgi:hypothetical protein
LTGFTDLDSDTLSVTALTADHGSVVNNGDGTYTITPTANYNGAVTLGYSVIDGNGGSVAATQTFTLAAVNDAPALTTARATLSSSTEDGTGYSVTAVQLLQGFSDARTAPPSRFLATASLLTMAALPPATAVSPTFTPQRSTTTARSP